MVLEVISRVTFKLGKRSKWQCKKWGDGAPDREKSMCKDPATEKSLGWWRRWKKGTVSEQSQMRLQGPETRRWAAVMEATINYFYSKCNKGIPPGGWDGSLPAMQETGVQSLGPEDTLKKEMATHSSLLVWEIPWTEEPGGLKESRHDWATNI